MIEISFLIWDPMDCFWMRSLSRTLIATYVRRAARRFRASSLGRRGTRLLLRLHVDRVLHLAEGPFAERAPRGTTP